MAGRSCYSCQFWDVGDGEPDSPAGYCRRYAPRPAVKANPLEVLPQWPTTSIDDWCGDYQPRPKP